MEGAELQSDGQTGRRNPKLPVWIIEHVWAHKMMDLQQVVDSSLWPDVDSQPLSLEDPWRLRVVSAQVYAIVKNRDVEKFERVIDFLESVYTLLPRLVVPIKHMKIIFGLKTMVIMWLLRTGRGTVETLIKIIQFFPSKLPQYQDQCSRNKMFHMRKSQLDFRTLAETLAMDKDKLQDYVKNHLEEQYGEHYAQKVEDRLLHYLQELETVLPGDTYIDKLLQKDSPVTDEEQLLLNVITSDSTTIAETLKDLLQCDAASIPSAHLLEVYLGSEVSGGDETIRKPTEVLETEEESRLSGEDKEGGGRLKEGTSRGGGVSSPHFCSRHQRWVKSILQQCPDECSEELLRDANRPLSSPLLLSSTTSSEDLTPSDLVPSPLEIPLTAPETCGQPERPGPSSSSPPPPPHEELGPQSSSSGDTLVPLQLSPGVRRTDGTSIRGLDPTSTSHRGCSHLSTMCGEKQAASTSGPQASLVTPTSPSKSTSKGRAAPASVDASTSTSSSWQQHPRPEDSSHSASTSRTSRTGRASRLQLRLSVQSQAVLLRSQLLQPSVRLTRLSTGDCRRLTDGRSSEARAGPSEQDGDDRSCSSEGHDDSFDPNCLYSSDSFSSDGGDSPDSDPEYKPRSHRKRLFLDLVNHM